MNWNIPGTTLMAQREEIDSFCGQLQAMFLGGGLAMSQVSGITGLDAYLIQNWVKRGYLSKPEQKRYSLNQLCRIITINMLRGALSMERICSLLGYVNGELDREDDDIISDADLYFLFLRLAARARELDAGNHWAAALEETLTDYQEPVPGAKERVLQVLRIMLTAWIAARMTREAENMMDALPLHPKEG